MKVVTCHLCSPPEGFAAAGVVDDVIDEHIRVAHPATYPGVKPGLLRAGGYFVVDDLDDPADPWAS